MRRLALVGLLVVVGVGLMANPLYLPLAVGETDPVYTHTVQPTDEGSPAYDATDVVAYEDLSPDAQAAFDRARESDDGGFAVEDPDERVDSLAYPTEPELGAGLLVVAHEDAEYEFWTRTVHPDPPATVVQRVALQPTLFLGGFFALLGAVAVAFRGRLGDGDS